MGDAESPEEEALVAAPPPGRLRATFASLRHPNYRLWFVGQLLSLVGTWMQSTAQGYLVYELTGSSAYLGVVAFAAGLPTWIFMLWAGVLADRVPRRGMLLATQVTMLVAAAAAAALIFAGLIRPWHLVVLAAVLGSANAFDAPARQAFVLELVSREHLGNAIALNSMMFNLALVIGPAVGGAVYAALGPGWCFAANSASFVGVIAALALMRLPAAPPRPAAASSLAELRRGLRYVAGHRAIRTVLLLVAAVTLLGFPYVSLLPAFATGVLHGDARTNGWLQTARGVGALAAAVYLAALGARRNPGRILALGVLVVPLGLLGFAAARHLALALACLVVVGAGLILVFNNANALVQTLAEDELRGRVLSVYSFSFFGLVPIGSLAMGALADHVGAPLAVGAGAALLVAAALLVNLLHPGLRRE